MVEAAARALAAIGFDVDTVLNERLGGHSDDEVWEAAQSVSRFLVTQDLDFFLRREKVFGNFMSVLEGCTLPPKLGGPKKRPAVLPGSCLRPIDLVAGSFTH